MSAIPDDIVNAGLLEAERYARWLDTMKTKGSLSPRAIDGLADLRAARALLYRLEER